MADPKRVAMALQYQQDKPDWWDAVPVADAPGTQRIPQSTPMSWLDRLNNLSAGLGTGITNQLEGYKQLVTHPVQSAKDVAQAVGTMATNPAVIVDALKGMGAKASSGSQGLGEVVGENMTLNPRRLAAMLQSPKIAKIVVSDDHPQLKMQESISQLERDALNAGSYENFKKGWVSDIKHGKYYHVTENPNFEIQKDMGPRDLSSLASGNMTPNALMITSDPEMWAEHYGAKRPYIAEIDVSQIPYNELKQVNRGMGNEFFIENAEKAKVKKIGSTKNMLEEFNEYQLNLPQSEKELRQFYENTILNR